MNGTDDVEEVPRRGPEIGDGHAGAHGPSQLLASARTTSANPPNMRLAGLLEEAQDFQTNPLPAAFLAEGVEEATLETNAGPSSDNTLRYRTDDDDIDWSDEDINPMLPCRNQQNEWRLGTPCRHDAVLNVKVLVNSS
jgi:hypothetical protein